MTERKTSDVGYMNPPEHTRYKKGKSGNPRGRPRKREDLNTVLQRVLNRKVRVKDNDQKLPVQDALIWKLRELALQGDKQALLDRPISAPIRRSCGNLSGENGLRSPVVRRSCESEHVGACPDCNRRQCGRAGRERKVQRDREV